MKNTNLIYESPDKGKRVYERQSGSSYRKLIMDNRTVDCCTWHEHLMENKLWAEIHHAAKTNVALADILEQAKIVYALIKKENN